MARKRKFLTDAQQKSIALIVTKDFNGMSISDIAEEVGVSRKTLYEWRKNQLYSDELLKQAEQMQRTFLADAYSQLRSLISNTSVADNNKLKAIEILLKNQGRLKDVQEQTVTVEEKSLDELLEEIKS